MSLQRKSTALPAPPAITAKWVKYVLSFGVTSVVGLAPYLGKIHVPLFSSILTFIPIYEQDTALTLSSAAMGVVAASVQWYGTEGLTKKKIKRWFLVALGSTVFFFLVLISLRTWVAVRVPVDHRDVYVVVGPHPQRLSTPPCIGLAASDCIGTQLTVNPVAIETYFGGRSVTFSSMGIVLAYVAFTASFAWLVALIVFRDR